MLMHLLGNRNRSRTLASSRPAAALALSLLWGCGGEDGTSVDVPSGGDVAGGDVAGGDEGGSVEGGGEGETLGGPTYFRDAAPIFADKCMGCHQQGGIGPFRLDDYDEALPWANRIAEVTSARIMPPYLMETGGDCGEFDESRALTEAEIQTLSAWVDAGAPEGEPAELSVPALPTLEGGIERMTPNFTPEIAGGVLAEFDEYRCFRIPLDLQSVKWATGWEVLPGNDQLIHHVIGYVVQPSAQGAEGTNAEVMEALDAESPDREGWPCFGGAGAGVGIDSVPITWAPGAGAVSYPGDIGIRVAAGSELVAQVHYNMADEAVRGQSDQTLIKLRLEDEVSRQAVFVLEDQLLGTLGDETPAVLPPGEEMVPYTWEASAGELLGPLAEGAELMALGAHMHERGRRWTFELAPGDGEFACAGRINRWDFNWQRLYTYAAPSTLSQETRMRLTCEYDTRGDSGPVLPGWGTRNEMCLVMMMVALPAGVTF